MSTAKLKKEALKQLQVKPLTLAELAVATGLKEKRVFRLLRSLFEGGEITSFRGLEGRKYRPTTDVEKAEALKAAALKAAEEGTEVEVEEDEEE